MTETKLYYRSNQCVHCYSDSKMLTVNWQTEIPGNQVEACIDYITSLIKAVPVRTLFIDSSNLEGDALSLDWRIIESSWEAFYNNGGEKIVVFNHIRQPKFVEDTYKEAIKNYGIPVKLEFRGKSQIPSY